MLRSRFLIASFLAFTFVGLATSEANAQAQLPRDVIEKIDKLATDTLARTGVPSASIAVVKDGQIAYVKTYGDARLGPKPAPSSTMRYSIGSISKHFTAAAILLLQEQGKLSLDDKVAKYVPNLTRANEVTVRQLLSHTSGYQDYWPQDYVMKPMLEPTTAQTIMDTWAKKPLDFEPGTKWQYSNTNFVIAGVIVEKVTRMPLLQFLQQKVFAPLGMSSVLNIDQEKLTESDPTGYLRFALGPLRPSPKEGKGWLFAAGELAMRAEDLAKWDLSIIDQKVLKPTSYRELGTEIVLKNGVGTQYGLGVSVGSQGSHRFLSHGGEVSGFTAQNMVFPDDRVAIVALTNQDAASAAGAITSGIAPLLFATSDAATATKLEQAKRIFADLQQGKIDRSLFTDNANAYFSEQALQDFARGLGPLGSPQSLVQASQGLRGGMTLRVYIARFPQRLIRAWTNEIPYRKLEQYQIAPQN